MVSKDYNFPPPLPHNHLSFFSDSPYSHPSYPHLLLPRSMQWRVVQFNSIFLQSHCSIAICVDSAHLFLAFSPLCTAQADIFCFSVCFYLAPLRHHIFISYRENHSNMRSQIHERWYSRLSTHFASCMPEASLR